MHKLRIELQASTQLTIVLLLLHLGAIIILFLLPLPWRVDTLLIVAILFSLFYHIQQQARKAFPSAIVTLVNQQDEQRYR